MAGGAGVGAGLGIMGGILGGIGDIMASAKYQRPSLPQPGGQEQRLRSLAQGQLIGGGLESLQGTQLYNQLVPIMMSLVPGMTVTPAAAGGAGAGGTAATTTAPMATYQQALSNYQNAIGRNQTIQNLQDQLKTMAKGPEKKATRQQLKGLKKERRGSPTVPQLERQIYQAGTVAPQMNVQMGGPTPAATGPGTVAGQQLSPTNQSTLAQIMGWLHGSQDAFSAISNAPPLQTGGGGGGDFLSDYTTALNAPRPPLTSTPALPPPYAPSQPTSTG